MINHVLVIGLIFFSFLFVGHRNLKKFLLFWGIFTIPFSYDYTFLTISGYHGWAEGILIRLSDLFLLALFFVGMINKRFVDARKIKLKFLFPILLFLIACLLSVPGAIWRLLCYFEIFQFCKIVILYYYVPIRVLQDEKDMRFVNISLLAALAFQSILAITQFVFQDFYNLFQTGLPQSATLFGTYIRSHGTVGRPNGFAAFIVPILLLNLSRIFASQHRERMIYIGSLILGLSALVFSFSRSGWISYIFCAILLFILGKKTRKNLSKYFIILILLVLIVGLFYPFLSARLTTYDEGAFEDRWYLMQIAFEIIKKNFFLGIGINNYWFAMNHYIPEGYDWPFIYTVHNVFLLIFAEVGIIGIIAIILLFSRAISITIRFAKEDNRELSLYALGLSAAFSAMVIQNLTDLTWASPIIGSLFFLLLGLTNAMINIEASRIRGAHQ